MLVPVLRWFASLQAPSLPPRSAVTYLTYIHLPTRTEPSRKINTNQSAFWRLPPRALLEQTRKRSREPAWRGWRR